MALIMCGEGGRQVSDAGAGGHSRNGTMATVMMALVASLLAANAGAATLKHVALACDTKAHFELAWQEIGSQDWNALAKQVADGECVNIPEGTTVYILDSSVLSGIVKIRPKGYDVTAWTSMEWIQLDSNNE